MRTISISLKEELIEKLKHCIPAKKISNFVSNAINNELSKLERELSLAYEQAEQQDERQELLKEWDSIDDIAR